VMVPVKVEVTVCVLTVVVRVEAVTVMVGASGVRLPRAASRRTTVSQTGDTTGSSISGEAARIAFCVAAAVAVAAGVLRNAVMRILVLSTSALAVLVVQVVEVAWAVEVTLVVTFTVYKATKVIDVVADGVTVRTVTPVLGMTTNDSLPVIVALALWVVMTVSVTVEVAVVDVRGVAVVVTCGPTLT